VAAGPPRDARGPDGSAARVRSLSSSSAIVDRAIPDHPIARSPDQIDNSPNHKITRFRQPIFLPSHVNGPPALFSLNSFPAYFRLTFHTKSISLMIAPMAMRDSITSSTEA